jgi:hypothetical protein
MQSINETGREHRERIAANAAESFKDHQLHPASVTATRWDRPMTWTCRKEGTGIYGFAVHFEPYAIFIWGDVGECVLRVSDPNSLAWFVSISDESYDYFVEKIRALEEPKKQFCYGDALAVLEEEVEEAERDARADLEYELKRISELPAEEAHGIKTPLLSDFLDDREAERLEHVREVRGAMEDVEDASAEEQQAAWFEAWGDLGIGASDVSSCETPTSSALWMWEARKVFARLYRDREFRRWVDVWAGVGKAIAHDLEQGINPAARAAAFQEFAA